MLDLEKKMAKFQEGGVVVEKKKICSISYPDDITFLATSLEDIKELWIRLGRVKQVLVFF